MELGKQIFVQEIDKPIIFCRPDGTLCQNAIVQNIYEDTGEVIFMELLGISTVVKGRLRIRGKEPYKRLFVQRVYPTIDE